MSKGSNKTVGQIQDNVLNGFAHAIRNSKFDTLGGIAPSFAPTKTIARPEPARRFSLNGLTKMNLPLPADARVLAIPTKKVKRK